MEHTLNHTTSLGIADVGINEVLFTVTSDIAYRPNGGGQGLLNIVNRVAKSGVKELTGDVPNPPKRYRFLTFDAGSSVALAATDPNGNLKSKVLGDKHAGMLLWYYVPTYLMFKSYKRSHNFTPTP